MSIMRLKNTATGVWEAVPSIVGPAGPAGATGPQGPTGPSGYSPTVTVTDITGGHRVTITDADGAHTFDVMDGQGGSGTVDSALSDTSENPVQNKVIKTALDAKGTYSKPSGGIPASDLASGVIPSVPSPASSGTPAMDGTAAVGTSTDYARADHVHPTDTSRAAASEITRIDAALATKADQASIQQTIEDEVDDWLTVQAPSIGTLSYSAKRALLNLLQHVAYDHATDSQYYNALESELFPDITLESITAVFTQGSAVIYDTDSLDTLKQYLVVTATYSDSTTATVTDYTLSGTLTAGTSTITVSYGGKTTTFTVNVTETVKLANGTHTFSDNSVVTVNNNHVTIYLATLVAGSSRFVNLSDLDGNTNSIFSNSNVNNKTTTFISLSANDTATLDVFNASSNNATWAPDTNYYDVAINARKYNGTASAFSPTITLYPANSTPGHEKITEGSTSLTASSSITMSCLFAYIASGYPAGTTVEFDVRVVA